MILYGFTLYLAFMAAGFPAGAYSLIWTQISERMTVPVPSISILRAMVAAGAVLACIFWTRGGRKSERNLDLCLAGVSFETLGLIGFSLSRVFWNLMLWSFMLGIGYGTSLTLLCIVVMKLDRREIMLYFSGICTGAFAGCWLLSETIRISGSWRTGCQVLGLVQILIAVTAFFIRRVLMKGGELRGKLEERVRFMEIARERQRNCMSLEPSDMKMAEKQYMIRTFCACIAAFLTGILVFCITLWPQSYRVAQTYASQELTGYGVLMVSLGMAAGRIAAGAFRPRKKAVRVTALAGAGILLILEQILISREALTDQGLLFFQLLEGAAIGPVFPSLLFLDDVRLDKDAEMALLSLLPAFSLGSYVLGTPLTQALVGGGQAGYFPLWLLVLAAGLGICLFFSDRGERD